MSANLSVFEVDVSVPIKGSRHYSAHGKKDTMQNIGAFIERTIVKTFHIEARNSQQAMQRCAKHGHVISARKTDVCEIEDIAEQCRDVIGLKPNPYPNAIAMSDMIWKRKTDRAVV